MRKLDNDLLGISESAGSRRLPKLESLLRSEVGAVMERELEIPAGSLLTITAVSVLPDLSEAKIGVSVLPVDQTDKVFKILLAAASHLQKLVNQRLRLYRVPYLNFYLDNSLAEADKIDQLLDSLNNKM